MWRSRLHSGPLRHLLHRFLPSPFPPSTPPLPFLAAVRSRSLSSSAPAAPAAAAAAAAADPDLTQSISAALVKLSASPAPALDLPDHFSHHFPNVNVNTPLLAAVLAASAPAGRAALDFYRYLVRHRSFTPSDASLSHLVHFFGRRRDFDSISTLLAEFRPAPGPLSLDAALLRLARSGRPTQAIAFFDRMERDFGLLRNRHSLTLLVDHLTLNGFPGHAEREVKRLASFIFPDEPICNMLIRGWCTTLKLNEARRLMAEMSRGGFDLGTPAYNAILDCVCRLARKKDPTRMQLEADKVLVEMEKAGMKRDAETFRVLIYNLCKIRKTEDAMRLFRTMGAWGCSPDSETYMALIRSLYQAARVSEGDEMIGFMRAAGYNDALDRKAYYGFIKILCGIERVEHAEKVFKMMKGYGYAPGVKTYNLLMEKLAAHNMGDRTIRLFQQAVHRGVPVTPKVYYVDPRYAKAKTEKKEKKRETLPEKSKRKRRTLKRLRLSFVKKPRSKQRRMI